MQTLAFSEVRAQLADALRSVEAGDEPVLISRHGQAAGVLMSFQQYQHLSGAGLGFAAQLQRWRGTYLAQVAGEGEGEASAHFNPFDGVRQTDEARKFAW